MQLHPEHRARPQQLGRHHGTAVVQIDSRGQPPAFDAVPERGFEPEGVLGVAPAIADEGPGVVVDEGE